MSEWDEAAKAVSDAWNDSGRYPGFHEEAQKELARKWPVLANAVANLARTPMPLPRETPVEEGNRIHKEIEDHFKDKPQHVYKKYAPEDFIDEMGHFRWPLH